MGLIALPDYNHIDVSASTGKKAVRHVTLSKSSSHCLIHDAVPTGAEDVIDKG